MWSHEVTKPTLFSQVKSSRWVFIYQETPRGAGSNFHKHVVSTLQCSFLQKNIHHVITENMSYSWRDTRKIKHLTFKTQPPQTSWMSQCVTTRTSVCVSWFFEKSGWSTVSLGQHDSNLGWYCLSISPATGSMKYNPLHCPMPQVLTCDNLCKTKQPLSYWHKVHISITIQYRDTLHSLKNNRVSCHLLYHLSHPSSLRGESLPELCLWYQEVSRAALQVLSICCETEKRTWADSPRTVERMARMDNANQKILLKSNHHHLALASNFTSLCSISSVG